MAAVMLALLVAAAAAPAIATPRMEPFAYFSVVADKPFAPFTVDETLKATSLLAYFSVVADAPYAPFTETDALRRTSTLAYYSVLH
jgi:2-keto-4-pentenoate hydratase